MGCGPTIYINQS